MNCSLPGMTVVLWMAAAIVLMTAAHNASAQALWQTLPEPAATPPPDATGFVTNDGARLYYAVHGQGPPVLLLHGGLGNADHWGGQIAALKVSHRVITMDSRGHGRSTWDGGQLSNHLMALDVLALMDHLKTAQAAIVGWSDGGNIGLDIAIHHPDRVAKLFILGANFHPSGMKAPPVGSTTVARYFERASADYRRLSSHPNELDRFLKALRAMWRSGPNFTSGQLSSISVPVVVAIGEHDEIVRREHAEQLANRIPGGRLLVLPELSHFALWQDVSRFNRALLDFLKP